MDDKTQLHHRIFATERSLIKAETRFKFYDFQGHLLGIWYSVFLVMLTVFQNVFRQHFSYVDEATISLSVTVLVFTVAISGFRFGQRADLYKASYLEMHRLRDELSLDKNADILTINQKYIDVLESSANHGDQDYIAFIVQRSLEGRGENDIVRKPSKPEICRYRWRTALKWLLMSILWLTCSPELTSLES